MARSASSTSLELKANAENNHEEPTPSINTPFSIIENGVNEFKDHFHQSISIDSDLSTGE